MMRTKSKIFGVWMSSKNAYAPWKPRATPPSSTLQKPPWRPILQNHRNRPTKLKKKEEAKGGHELVGGTYNSCPHDPKCDAVRRTSTSTEAHHAEQRKRQGEVEQQRPARPRPKRRRHAQNTQPWTAATERGTSAGPGPIPERSGRRKRSGSRPGKGVTETSRIRDEEWTTLPVEILVERRLLDMSLKQLELRCTSNTVHYVLNE